MGKAKSLRHRLQSYTRLKQLNDRILELVQTAVSVQWEVLDSELLALITEAELIHTYQPPYNVSLKDDKSPLYICIPKGAFAPILHVRKIDMLQHQWAYTFGPYPSGYQVRQVLKLIRPIFRWCESAPYIHSTFHGSSIKKQQFKPCFYYHLGLCAGACAGEVTAAEYQTMLKDLALFLRGKTRQLSQKLHAQMQAAAQQEQFELAGTLRDRLTALEQVTTIGRLRPDPTLLTLHTNSAENKLIYLQRLLVIYLGLPKHYPLHRIEGYDVSNLGGQQPVVAQVVATDGQPDPNKYRLYNIRSLQTPNDFAMLQEALIRRQNHPEWPIPNLILIDGGRGQVRAVRSALQWDVPVIGIAKNPDRLIFPKTRVQQGKTIYTYTEVRLPQEHPGLQLLAALRDEAHRFSRKQHFRLRDKHLLQ